jgi:hypothetical protein
MKDQYVGDINDYLKYSLLRALGVDGLGVVWMLTPSDQRNDGQRVTYLERPHQFRHIDPVVFDALQSITAQDDRTIAAVEQSGVLNGAAFVSATLHDGLDARSTYFEQAWAVVRDCSVVFFDPDNGLAVKSVPAGRRSSSKYLGWHELTQAYDHGHSVLVYQHFPRRPRKAFLGEVARRVRAAIPNAEMAALTTSHVAFLLIAQERDAAVLTARLLEFATRALPHATADVIAPAED